MRATVATVAALAVFAAYSAAGMAQTQPTPQDPPPPQDPDDKPPEEEKFDPSLFDGVNPGEDETPDAPDIDLAGDKQAAVTKKIEPPKPPGYYPQKVVERPITMPEGMVEATLGYYVNANPFRGDGLIGGRFGITDQIQIGLRYGFGSANEDGYEPGKTFSIDFEYLLRDWVAIQLGVPILVDPISVGVTLGAPMKFQFRERWSFQVLRNLISFRTNRFVPEIENSLATAGLADADDAGTGLSDGEISVEGSAIYQWDQKFAFELRTAFTATDFDIDQDAFLFDGGVYYAHTQKLDLGARIGFQDMNDASDTFGVSIFANIRM